MTALDFVGLTPLMKRTSGNAAVKIGLIDGPILANHPDLTSGHVSEIPGTNGAACNRADSTACMHGTFVAGILFANRNSQAPAICPNCTLIVRPVFTESKSDRTGMPSSTPDELAAAVIECVESGARVINLSLALARPSTKGEKALEEAFDYAAKRQVIIVAASGNQGTLGSSAITRHPWVIPVVACDLRGRPVSMSNLGSSIGRNGLSAPGYNITSLGAGGKPLTLSGTSAAAPFVTGAIALLMSEFPRKSSAELKLAVTGGYARRRNNLVPPVIDVDGAYRTLAAVKTRSFAA